MVDVDWALLRARTQARIGLGRRGHALATRDHLAFQAAHAAARDAIWTPWRSAELVEALATDGVATQVGASGVSERRAFLLNPNEGRRLSPQTRDELRDHRLAHGPSDVCVLVSDGLSAHALHAQGHALVRSLVRALQAEASWLGTLAPVVLVPFGRVALSDAVGAELGASLVIHVIGERPGLSAVDSVALYITYAPREGNTDADRNCISNVREPHGQPHAEAIRKALYFARETKRLGHGGYRVEDESEGAVLNEAPASPLLAGQGRRSGDGVE